RITHEVYHFTPLIEPAKEGVTSNNIETLTIHRDSGHMQLNENELLIYGIVGFINLIKGEYLIVITGCKKIGSLVHNAEIYRATSFQILPVTHGLSSLSKADGRFFWNQYLCEKFINATLSQTTKQDFSAYILPMIQGFVTIIQAVINSRAVTFALISRRSKERAGTRYFSRGLDEHGYVSNYVETEQLLLCDPAKSLTQENLIQASHIQTRGSVPAFWGQIPNTRYTPKLWVNSNLLDEKILHASKAHFDQQIKLYGPQILVNLTNTKGYEYPVGHVFSEIIKELSDRNLKFIHFDFHKECCKMRWNRVQLLIDQLESDLRKQAFCLYDATYSAGSKLRKVQTSVVRTNCMDCLDRTNVVQSTIARWVLNKQLREIGILQSTEVIENDEKFMHLFKNAWADNADGLSICYSGTGALKTDFTRTGKHGIDLILGRYKVPLNHAESPFKESASSIIVRSVPLYLLGTFIVSFLLLFKPSLFRISSTLIQIISLSFTLAISITCWMCIEQNSAKFVNWPKLVPHQVLQDIETRLPDNVGQHNTAKRLVQKWTRRRSSSALLNEVEQGYEMATANLKKTT
ncbi:SacI homology domain-containing protein, partial [Mycotypha africana]|uniref:Sac phosphatase domain-containing protein n=1 Tax=Mycotypha africana TaxID=64632 RepID=UPI0023016661